MRRAVVALVVVALLLPTELQAHNAPRIKTRLKDVEVTKTPAAKIITGKVRVKNSGKPRRFRCFIHVSTVAAGLLVSVRTPRVAKVPTGKARKLKFRAVVSRRRKNLVVSIAHCHVP